MRNVMTATKINGKQPKRRAIFPTFSSFPQGPQPGHFGDRIFKNSSTVGLQFSGGFHFQFIILGPVLRPSLDLVGKVTGAV